MKSKFIFFLSAFFLSHPFSIAEQRSADKTQSVIIFPQHPRKNQGVEIISGHPYFEATSPRPVSKKTSQLTNGTKEERDSANITRSKSAEPGPHSTCNPSSETATPEVDHDAPRGFVQNMKLQTTRYLDRQGGRLSSPAFTVTREKQRGMDADRAMILSQELESESRHLETKRKLLHFPSGKDALLDELRDRIKEEVRQHEKSIIALENEIQWIGTKKRNR